MSEQETQTKTGLPQQLRQAREGLSWSPATVAEKLNLSEEQIAKLENTETEIADLTPFERGYLRNYAALVEVDITAYEAEFPSGHVVGADLKSVERYRYQVPKPLMQKTWFKAVLYSVLFIFILWLISMLDIQPSDFENLSTDSTGNALELPFVDASPEPIEPPEQ